MTTAYFQHRRPFDFHPHPFQIGNLLGVKTGYEDNQFCLKLYGLPSEQFAEFYECHLKPFLEANPGMEREFFAHVWKIVNNRIRHYDSRDPFSGSHALHVANGEKLTAFKDYLVTMDHWKVHFPVEAIIGDKDQEIQILNERINKLEAELAKLRLYEASEKISIADGKLAAVIHLFRQLQDLLLPNSKKLFRYQTQSGWYKMLAKYFDHGGNEIPVNTARNYFPAQRNVPLIKGSEVKDEDKLFNINPS
ncbi:hypothetical protein [Hufsiella ginkgonis]|uniref:Uncharacterized protein n=1 Tax=Hufsiella ginkgonis TaxID=2695274 RepID=A0A7K1XZU1_9SPHI|nr:hypothetical protein [Hufsiella ginkgonis]MXV16534.1 hypothetical protein [Hufsiella ginkgonis]